MDSRPLRFFLIVICLTLLAGCGSASKQSSRSQARSRAAASARLTRATFAIAGLGMRVTRSTGPRGSARLRAISSALKRSRSALEGQDRETGLYYAMTVNPDGSGRQDLFTDVGHATPAGSFNWPAPTWNAGQVDNYPATMRMSYSIAAGEHSGLHGTADFTALDPEGANGAIRVTLTDSQNEYVEGDFTVENGMVSGIQRARLPDYPQDWYWREVDETRPDATMLCTITFLDGSKEAMEMNADGNTIQTIFDTDGSIDAMGEFDMNGMDYIEFDQGDWQVTDVDSGENVDSGHNDDWSGWDNVNWGDFDWSSNNDESSSRVAVMRSKFRTRRDMHVKSRAGTIRH